MRPAIIESLAVLFFVTLIAIVFHQVNTSMVEQGIASGSPYDNAAAYPQAVAIILMVLLGMLAVFRWMFPAPADNEDLPKENLNRLVILLAVIGIYLFALDILGYHIATAPMIMAIMFLSGYFKIVEVILVSVTVSLSLSLIFEVFLKIVLPGGVWNLNIPWNSF